MAAKTLLNAVNDMFKAAHIIVGDADALTTLTDSARQGDIDYCVIALNQVIDELYSTLGESQPQQQLSSTITLVAGQRDYTLATNYTRLHFPLIDQPNAQYIIEYEGGYNEILEFDPEVDDVGLPVVGMIRPTDGKLYLYPTPQAVDAGKVYTYQYDKDTELSGASDSVPFNNAVYRAIIPAAFQVWKRERRDQFDAELFKTHFGRAARLLSGVAPRDEYSPR